MSINGSCKSSTLLRMAPNFMRCRLGVRHSVLASIALSLFFSAIPSPAANAQSTRATVRLEGRALFRVGPQADLSAEERAARIERRLTTLLEESDSVAPPRVDSPSTNNERIITVSGIPVVTVSQQDAEDNVTNVDALARQWANTLDARLRSAAQRRESIWGRFRSEVQGSVEGAFARLIESAITIIPRLTAAFLVIGLFWCLAALVRWMMRQFFRLVIDDLTLENLLKQVSYYSVWILGFVLALDALGFQPQTVVTGLGLTSLALGFALKDIISNFVSGLLLLLLRPFRLGDQIIVGETEGSVERIQLRATQIRTYDGRAVLVPNSELFTSRVTNNTASQVRRGTVNLYLGYDVDLSELPRMLASAVQMADGVLPDRPVTVRIADFTASDIVIEVRFWSDSRRSDFQATSANVRTTALDALSAAKVPLPDPANRKVALRTIDA
jgi:small conductance mechanosensitive channel